MIAKQLLLIPVILLVVMASGVSAEVTEYEDLGTFYGYTLQFVYTGSNAQSVYWDFGDGCFGEGISLTHTYSEKGTYYVEQAAHNDANRGTDSVMVYRITVAGYPWIEFDSNGGSAVSTIIMESGGTNAAVAEKPDNPVKDGYTFGGWYTDSALTQPYNWMSVVTEPLTLYALWTMNDITVCFDTDGGSETKSQSILYGGTVSEPEDPVKDGYTFGGWYLNESPYDFSSSVTEPMTLTAHWSSNAGDGSGVSIPSGGTETGITSSGADVSESGSNGMWLLILLILLILALLDVTSRYRYGKRLGPAEAAELFKYFRKRS